MWSRVVLALTFSLAGCAQTDAPPPSVPAQVVAPVCPHKTMCKEMTSCAEAEYQLKTCHQYALDKNKSGIPCPKEHCGTTKEEMLKRISAKPYTPPPFAP